MTGAPILGAEFSADNSGETIMDLNAVPGWEMDLDRGPDWLFVRLRPPQHGDTSEVGLAETIWQMMNQSFTHRAVLEMDDIWLLRSWMVGELVKLHKRIAAEGGLLRLAGMNDGNQEVPRLCRLDDRFPQYDSRTSAVMGRRCQIQRSAAAVSSPPC